MRFEAFLLTSRAYTPLNTMEEYVQCKFQANGLHCDEKLSFPLRRWYYDVKMEDCMKFRFYNCVSEIKNVFRTYRDCKLSCQDPGVHPIERDLPENAACALQPSFGECMDYVPMWYFDISTFRCRGFAYSGCGGNQNRFPDDKSCQKVCMPALENLNLKPAKLRELNPYDY